MKDVTRGPGKALPAALQASEDADGEPAVREALCGSHCRETSSGKKLQEPCELTEVKVRVSTKGASGFSWHSILGKHFQKGRGEQDHVAVSSGWFRRATARSLPYGQVRRVAGCAHSPRPHVDWGSRQTGI